MKKIPLKIDRIFKNRVKVWVRTQQFYLSLGWIRTHNQVKLLTCGTILAQNSLFEVECRLMQVSFVIISFNCAFAKSNVRVYLEMEYNR